MSDRPPESQREALDRRAKQVLERFVNNKELVEAARSSIESIRCGEKPKPFRELAEELRRKREGADGV